MLLLAVHFQRQIVPFILRSLHPILKSGPDPENALLTFIDSYIKAKLKEHENNFFAQIFKANMIYTEIFSKMKNTPIINENDILRCDFTIGVRYT